MGLWPLIFVGIVGFTILYAWFFGEAEKRKVPIIILLSLTVAFCVGMGILGQWFLVIGTAIGSLLGVILLYIFTPVSYRLTLRQKETFYVDYCWKCGHKIDRREAEACPKCHKHYICPKCHKCKCDNPHYKPEEDKALEIKK